MVPSASGHGSARSPRLRRHRGRRRPGRERRLHLGRHSARPDFEALHEPESNILCFRYVADGSLDPERLDRLNLRLREVYNRSGEGWITTTLLGERRPGTLY
jgi:hypothetical protein